MGRLIDADKLLDALCDGCTGIPCEGNRHGSTEQCVLIREVCNAIDEQPTAYDVEKVINELDDCSANHFGKRNEYDMGKTEAYDYAIEIVSWGGIGDF